MGILLRSFLFTTLTLTIATASFAQKQKSAPPKKEIKVADRKFTSNDFARIWRGEEKCNQASAPVAIVVITAVGNMDVLITGLYSFQGKVKGRVSGSTIFIPLQDVDDPNFQNVKISGTLTLSADMNALEGKLSILNNDQPDECKTVYRK